MNKTPAPPGFTISFSRHARSWGWKQTYATTDAHDKERWGFRSRRLALADLCTEVEQRKGAKSGAKAPVLAEA